jgi:hypothetical protein
MEFLSTLIYKCSKGTFPHANHVHGPSFLIPTTGELLPPPLAIFQWPQTRKTGSSRPPLIGAGGAAAGVAAGCGQSGRGWAVVALWRAPTRHTGPGWGSGWGGRSDGRRLDHFCVRPLEMKLFMSR